MLPEDWSDSASQQVTDAHIHRTENGKLQLMLEAPLIQKFERPVVKTIYKSRGEQRVTLTLYDGTDKKKTYIEAGEATSYDDRDIMEAYDSVVVIDYGTGDTIYLQDLIWNSAEDRIYSEHPVRADWQAAYEKTYPVYADIYAQMKPLFDKLAAIGE